MVRIAANIAGTDSARSCFEAEQSANRYGKSEIIIESDYLYHRETADRIAYWLIQSNCYAQLQLTYATDISFAFLQLGDVISLTDVSLGLDDKICTIVSKQMTATQCILGVLLQNNPQ